MKKNVFILMLILFFLISPLWVYGLSPSIYYKVNRTCYENKCMENKTLWDSVISRCIYNPENEQKSFPYLPEDSFTYLYNELNINNISDENKKADVSIVISDYIATKDERYLLFVCNELNLTDEKCKKLGKLSLFLWDKDILESDLSFEEKSQIGEIYTDCIYQETAEIKLTDFLPLIFGNYKSSFNQFVFFISLIIIIIVIIFLYFRKKRGKKR